ncbi:ribosomal protein, partial [Oryctes borbonicus]
FFSPYPASVRYCLAFNLSQLVIYLNKKMGKRNKYTRMPPGNANICKAKASNMSVHFKNTCETANTVRGMTVKRATAYLKNVLIKKECVPFKKFRGGIGRCAQAKNFHTTIGRWPQKSAKYLLDLLQNAISNAEYTGLDCELLYIYHIQVNAAPLARRRTYRAHGVINPYMGHPCHLEIVLAEKSAQ